MSGRIPRRSLLYTPEYAKVCNGEIGGAEEQFCRAGPEAFFRQYYGVSRRSTHDSVNPFQRGSAGAPAIDFKAFYTGFGVEILWQFNPGERTVKEVRQIVVVDASVNSHPLRIQGWMTKPSHLKDAVDALSVEPKDIYVFADDDETDWVNSLVSGVASGVIWSAGQANETVSQAKARTEIGDKYFRALAKIGLHYLIAASAQITGSEPEFAGVREFIRHGSGSADSFFKEESAVIIQRNSSLARPERPAHFVTAEWTSTWVAARMQFFFGPDYEPPTYLIRLAPGVAALPDRGAIGHAYVYFEGGPQGKFAGEVSELLVQLNE